MQDTRRRDDALSIAQNEILASGMLSTGFNCLLQLPTAAGKTWLCEQAIAAALERGARAIYLAPLRALARELFSRWQERFPSYQVGIFTGDYGRAGNPYPVSFRDARILILTPEKLDACTRAWRRHLWIAEADLLAVDEIHLIGEDRRGACLESTISRMRRLNPFLMILGMSATLGNRNELAQWLQGIEYSSTWRPVALNWRIARYRKAADKPEMLASEVARTVRSSGKSLVFVQSRRRAEDLTHYLQSQGIRALHYHAGLSHHERHTVEERFRGTEIDCVLATSALELGVNLPARQVILYDLQEFDGIDYAPLSTNRVWQRAGRAGRPGLDASGEVVLFAWAWDRDAKYYEQGRFEPILSALSDPQLLAEQILIEVVSGLARTPLQLKRLFAQSLAAYQQRLPDIDVTISEMRAAGMLKEDGGKKESGSPTRCSLVATRIGSLAVRHHLCAATLLLFKRVLDEIQTPTILDLLILAACSQECEPLLYVNFEELNNLGSSLEREPSSLLQLPANQLLHLLGIRGKRLLSSIKMGLTLRVWTRVSDTSVVARASQCYPYEVERLAEACSRLLQAMASIMRCRADATQETASSDQKVSTLERIRSVQRMVAMGLSEEAATLTLIDGIGSTLARRLWAAGIQDIEDLALAEPTEICHNPGISEWRARRWIAQANSQIKTHSALRYRERGAPARLPPADWPPALDPYRLRRALDLVVEERDDQDYTVSGGLDPHLLRQVNGQLLCDCLDAGKGNVCKHILAVRLYRGESALREFALRFEPRHPDAHLDLFALWSDTSLPPSPRSAR